MPVASVASLLEALRAYPFLEPEALAQLAPLTARFPEPKALAKELVRRGWLTLYQANHLLQGRGAELLLGPYVLLDRLGAGGMGQVFKARQRKLDRLCALKVIRKECLTHPDAVRRFQREAKAAARLCHPNIITIFDCDEVEGTHYLAMEYIEGADLAQLVEENGPLPVAEACRYVRQAALGLQHAHERGLAHRDIKPHNLLVSGDGSQVKLLDLGLALRTGGGGMSTALTQQGAIMGTPDYMAPEQCMDAHQADIRSDLYSLGCTLYHVLAGQAPFAGGMAVQVIACHLKAAPPPLRESRADVPEGLEGVVRKLMAKEPGERYQTPAEAAAALAPYCDEGGGTFALAKKPKAPAALVPTEPSVHGTVAEKPTPLPRKRRRSPQAVSQRGGRKQLFWMASIGVPVFVGLLVLRTWWKVGSSRKTVPPAPATIVQTEPLAVTPSPKNEGPQPTPLPRQPDPGPSQPAVVKQPSPPPATLAKEITNSIGLKLVRIPSGKFLMGSPKEEEGRFDGEDRHEVEITQPFYLGVYEVTQKQYAEVMGKNPSWFSPQGDGKEKVTNQITSRLPVENVSWEDAVEFCRILSERPEERRAGRIYRLPTEAEWEYACRGGAQESTRFHFGQTPSLNQANIDSRLSRTAAVGSYKPNGFGLYDMHGNVWEWCQDWYDKDYYKTSPQKDPPGPDNGTSRVLRGGSWFDDPRDCRAAYRYWIAPGDRNSFIGFRVACRVGAGTP